MSRNKLALSYQVGGRSTDDSCRMFASARKFVSFSTAMHFVDAMADGCAATLKEQVRWTRVVASAMDRACGVAPKMAYTVSHPA